jgi:hypothetical protein
MSTTADTHTPDSDLYDFGDPTPSTLHRTQDRLQRSNRLHLRLLGDRVEAVRWWVYRLIR